MPAAVIIQLIAMKGSERRMIYLRPSLSMKKIERMVPVALKADRGMLRTRELSVSSRPPTVMPADFIISGP